MSAANRLQPQPFDPPARLMNALLGLAVVGAALFGLAAFLEPERAWGNLLIAGSFVLALSVGPLFFLAIQYVAKAGWSTAFRRVPEAMTAALPLAAILLLAVLAGRHHVYEWTHLDVVRADEILRGKQAWLNVPFFAGREILAFVVWIAFARLMVARSLRQDQDHDLSHTNANVKLGAAFCVLFAITFSVASWDWLMSVEPHWFSTIFSVYHFAGTLSSTVAGILILVVALRRLGPYRDVVRDDHIHDLAKLLFGFCTFWAYIWVSQYLLTWYANLGEETPWFVERLHGGWGTLTWVNLGLNWLVPFLVLLPRPNKRNEKVVVRIAVVVLIGHWLDLYLMVMPNAMGDSPTFHYAEAGPIIGALALYAWVVLRAVSRRALVPVGDPTLGESLHYHN